MTKTREQIADWINQQYHQRTDEAARYENDALVAKANASRARKDAEILSHLAEIVRLG